MDNKNITINDIAKELGLSKSTVSRVISGTGRISDSTRERVMECINRYGFSPNPLAKGLAESKSYNIGVVIPSERKQDDVPFFQNCLIGISEVAEEENYDVLVSVSQPNYLNLKRLIKNRKVDGVVLTRLSVDDREVAYLEKVGIPFVVMGTNEDMNCTQIDCNHLEACRMFTAHILNSGVTKVVLLLGNTKIVVNRQRREGFEAAVKLFSQKKIKAKIMSELLNSEQIRNAVKQVIALKPDCIICGDDYICGQVMHWLNQNNYSVPGDVMVGSFYDSIFLEQHNPPVSAIGLDVHKMGKLAGEIILNKINQQQVELRNFVGYELLFRDSTRKEREKIEDIHRR